MSNKFKKKNPKAKGGKQQPVIETRTPIKKRQPLKISFRQLIPLSLVLVFFIILWFKPYQVKLTDPWYEAITLIDSSKKVADTNQRNFLFDQGGKILTEQVQKHPYHARVHYLYGYYWYNRQNWDSVIFHEREAIRIGAGGIVNQVEFVAQDLLNSALGNKVMPLINEGKLEQATQALQNAKTPNMYNPGVDKYLGIVYSRVGNSDSALACFLRYHQADPNNAENLTNIAIMYNQKNLKDSARIYINQALKLDPNFPNAKLINSQLNNQ